MKQKTKKNFAKGIIISGLLTIVLSGAGSLINRSEIERASQQKRRLLEYNNQIYSISLQNPSTYNQNVAKINELEEEIRGYQDSNSYFNLFLVGGSVIMGGIALYKTNKN